jgi:hypothetical protein
VNAPIGQLVLFAPANGNGGGGAGGTGTPTVTERVRDAAAGREVTAKAVGFELGLREQAVRDAFRRLGARRRQAGRIPVWLVPLPVPAEDDLTDLDLENAKAEESTAHAAWLARIGAATVPRCRCVEGPAVFAAADADEARCSRCGRAPQ